VKKIKKIKKSKKPKKAPYVYLVKGKNEWDVYVKLRGRHVYVGRFKKWINAVIGFNEVMSYQGGLLPLQRGLRKRKQIETLTKNVLTFDAYQKWLNDNIKK